MDFKLHNLHGYLIAYKAEKNKRVPTPFRVFTQLLMYLMVRGCWAVQVTMLAHYQQNIVASICIPERSST